MQNSKKRKLKPQNLLIVLACICLIIGTFVVLLSNHSASNSDSKAKTVNKHYETIATVMIDAGHGGYDGGTVAKDGTTEKDLTLALALETGKQLKKLNPEIKVVYTRTSDKVTWSEDETEDLKARVKMAKKKKPIISSHSISIQMKILLVLDMFLIFVKTIKQVNRSQNIYVKTYLV